MTDMKSTRKGKKSTRKGKAQTGYFTRNNKKLRPGEAIWGDTDQINLKDVLSGNTVRPVKDEPVSIHPKTLNLPGPKPGSYLEDPEGLKIEESCESRKTTTKERHQADAYEADTDDAGHQRVSGCVRVRKN
jgi:hypothetical protein